jgi:hypothetical protein
MSMDRRELLKASVALSALHCPVPPALTWPLTRGREPSAFFKS